MPPDNEHSGDASVGSERPQSEQLAATPAHEASDIHLPTVVAVLFGIGLSAVMIHVALWSWLKEGGAPSIDAARWNPATDAAPGSPRLQTSPAQDLGVFRGGEAEQLAASQIERAMKQVTELTPPATKQGSPGVSPLQLQQERATKRGAD